MMATMEKNLKNLARAPALNAWGLFLLVSTPMSLLMILEMHRVDLGTATGVSDMIGYSVRFSIPFIYIVASASALQKLFPGPFSSWLLRNRRYLGFCFAVAMAWQAAFIARMSLGFNDYYYEEVYLFRNELEGSIGYIFLTFMLITSFQPFRSYLTSRQWRLLHTCGIYVLWAYVFVVYWWNVSYYENPEWHDHVYYWAGFITFVLRIAAWGKLRLKRGGTDVPAVFRIIGSLIIMAGLALSATGLYWQDQVTNYLTQPAWSEALVLWLPYWPFEPFIPLMTVGLGTMLYTQPFTQARAVHA